MDGDWCLLRWIMFRHWCCRTVHRSTVNGVWSCAQKYVEVWNCAQTDTDVCSYADIHRLTFGRVYWNTVWERGAALEEQADIWYNFIALETTIKIYQTLILAIGVTCLWYILKSVPPLLLQQVAPGTVSRFSFLLRLWGQGGWVVGERKAIFSKV